MSENYRIENPKEEFRKILHTKLGEVSHEYFGCHGEYRGPEPCEKPKIDRELPPAYLNYFIFSEEYGNLINSIFYEDSRIDEDYLEKIYFLSLNFACPYKKIPTYTIITQLPLDECVKEVVIGTTYFHPSIFSFADYDSVKHYQKIKDKINAKEEFENVEALDILFIAPNCKINRQKTLKNVCECINQMIISDDKFKSNLKEAMKCVIHEYGESVDEIKKLEKIIDDNSH